MFFSINHIFIFNLNLVSTLIFSLLFSLCFSLSDEAYLHGGNITVH